MGKGCALCKPACFLARKEAGHKTGKQCMWPTTCDFCLLVATPPNPFDHRISFCGYAFCERFLSVPGTPFRSIGIHESLIPFVKMVRPEIELYLEDEVAKYHLIRNTFQ